METAAPSADNSAASAIPESFSSPDEAARYWISARNQRDEQPTDDGDDDLTADGADEATAAQELSGDDNAAPDEDQAHGEDEGADPEAEELPPIERPKSWAKEDQAEWDELPRSLQEKLAARESTREKAIRNGQNETAEKLKGLTAKEQAVEQARQQYEAKARDALKILEDQQRQFFPDIKSMDDLEAIANEAHRLSGTDPLRSQQLLAYLKAFDVHQQKFAAMAHAVREADERKANELQTKRAAYNTEQRAKLSELVPELADDKAFNATWERAMPELDKLGFSKERLAQLASTETGYEILLSAGFQKLIADSLKLQDMQAAAKKQMAKPVPHVQRPGARQPAGNSNSERVQALTTKLNNSGSLKDAAALLIARRSGRR
jgi:hypothetical protein